MAQSKSLTLVDRNTTSKVDRKYWSISAANPAELSTLWSIGLWDLAENKPVALKGRNLDPAGGRRSGYPFFQFPTPPQVYEISEAAATTIVPTQNGGKFIESHGNIFKDIRISGTTGVRPNPVSQGNLLPGSVTQATGITISVPKTVQRFLKDERGLNVEEATGFDDMIFLRNIFRLYFDLKKRNDMARRVVMIFKCSKESEVYIVEPMSFTTSRDSSNPMAYTYNIQLRTLYRYDQKITFTPKKDPLKIIKSISGAIDGVNQGIRDLSIAIQQLGNALDTAVQLPFSIAEKLTASALSTFGALISLKNLGSRLEATGQGGVDRLRAYGREFEELHTILVNGQETGSPRPFSSAPETSSAADGLIPVIAVDSALEILRTDAIRAARSISRTAARLLYQDSLFQQPRQQTVTDVARAYNIDGKAPFSSGSALDPNNIVIPSSAREEEVKGNETIRGIAKRLLGSAEFWKTLVILNNLKPPYISTTEGDGVLAPGSKILVPQLGNEGDFTSIDEVFNADAASENLSALERKLGRDLKISNSSVGSGLADLQVGRNGDLDLIESLDNVNQAIMIKFSTEEGELALHPYFGAAYPVGTKVDINRLQDFALNTRATFLSDDRIEDVVSLRFFVDGDIVQVNAQAQIKQVNSKLPVQFAVRRL